MIDKQFWEEAGNVWTQKICRDYDQEGMAFDDVDFDAAMDAIFSGGDIPLKPGTAASRSGTGRTASKTAEAAPEPESAAPVPPKPKLDGEKFEALLAKQTIADDVKACEMLLDCRLPENMDSLYHELIKRLQVLCEASVKFKSVYQADLTQFYEYYIPEALQVTATYLEYREIGIGEEILQETEKEVRTALERLLQAVNEKTDEIYKFASMEIKAKAKALESLMSQDGYIDSRFKID